MDQETHRREKQPPLKVSVIGDRRILALLLLGFASGLPRLLVYKTLAFWLLEEGLSIGAVGLFAATALPYNLKPLWAPFVDARSAPFLGKLGRRRSWIILAQLGILLSLFGLSQASPSMNIGMTALWAVMVAIFSATQDIAIDAYRIEILEEEEQGAGAASVVMGYRAGMLVASAGALYLAAFTESWSLSYVILASMMVFGLLTALFLCPSAANAQHLSSGPSGASLLAPFRELVKREGAWLLFLLVMTYKLGDALGATMLHPLLLDLSFSKLEIANVAKSLGLVMSLVGVVAGGWLVRTKGVLGALWIAGILQVVTNLLFVAQAEVGHDSLVLAVSIGAESLSGGLGTTALVAFLSAQCARQYSATQYALLASASSVLQTLLSAPAGFLAESISWSAYYSLTTLAGVPGLVLVFWYKRRSVPSLKAH